MSSMQASIPASVSLALAAPRARSYGRRSYGRSKSYGRSRSYSRGANYYKQRAGRRRAYIAGRYPKAQWAHPWVERGTQQAAALGIGEAGTDFSQATPSQQARRKQIGWYGKGDYALGPAMDAGFTGLGTDGMRITDKGNTVLIRKEVFAQLICPTSQSTGVPGQQILNFPVNMGLDEVFPWGSQIANNFRKYKISQLAFKFETALGENYIGTTSQIGTVNLAWNPDAVSEDDITTQMQAANDQGSVQIKGNENGMIWCEADDKKGAATGFLLMRNKRLRAQSKASDYDFGELVVTINGFPLGFSGLVQNVQYPIGRLVVYYCVELSHSIINTAMGSSIDNDLFVMPTTTTIPAVPTAGTPAFCQTWLSGKTFLFSDNNVGGSLFENNILASAGLGSPNLSYAFPSTSFGYYRVILSMEANVPAAFVLPAAGVPSLAVAPQMVFSGNSNIGPVYDQLTTGTLVYGSASFSSPCNGPQGAAIVDPLAPYGFCNSWYSTSFNPAAVVPAGGGTIQYTFICDVYVPGVQNQAVAVPNNPTASPIVLTCNFANVKNYFCNGAPGLDFTAFNASKVTFQIAEMNATMRSRLNGSNDAPYLQNSNFVPQALTSAQWN